MKNSDLSRFSKAVLLLDDCQSPADLGPTLFRAVQALCDSDKPVVNTFNGRQISVQIEDEVLPPAFFETFNAHVHEHPLFPIIDQKENAPKAGRWTDFTSLRSFRQTALYHDFFRPIDVHRQLASRINLDYGAWISLVFNRGGSDFRPEDVILVEQFLPHVERLIRRLINRIEVQDALALREAALSGDAVMVFKSDGTLLFATARARRLMLDSFTETDASGTPIELRQWLRRDPPAGDTLVCHRSWGRLACTCGPSAPWSRNEASQFFESEMTDAVLRCVRLQEHRRDYVPVASDRFGLTAREAQVLWWIGEGKRNSEIAVILGCSGRTVEKHCEHVFAKLGVETRTAAAGFVAEIFRHDGV